MQDYVVLQTQKCGETTESDTPEQQNIFKRPHNALEHSDLQSYRYFSLQLPGSFIPCSVVDCPMFPYCHGMTFKQRECCPPCSPQYIATPPITIATPPPPIPVGLTIPLPPPAIQPTICAAMSCLLPVCPYGKLITPPEKCCPECTMPWLAH